jgi:pyroglutamyl-peptidase
MRVLLTAFEPFDGTGLNASLEGCRRFLERRGEAYDLRFAVLPVEYGRDTEAVERALSEGPADLLLHTGQAVGCREIRVERVAVNRRYSHAHLRTDDRCPIDPDGPPRLEATLPVEALAEAVRAEGIPAAVSDDAGVYLCNHVLYRSLQRAAREGGGRRVGFLHVPRLPEQAGEGTLCMRAEEIARALEAVLARLAGADTLTAAL